MKKRLLFFNLFYEKLTLKIGLIIAGTFFCLSAFAQPPNDDLTNAFIVNSLPFEGTVFKAEADNATSEPNENACGSPKSWWYTFNVISPGIFDFTTASAPGFTSPLDVEFGLYTGNAHPLTEVFCEDFNTFMGQGESKTINLTVGTYYLRIGFISSAMNGVSTTISSAGGAIGPLGTTAIDSSPIPTMSQWGLLIFGLLILNMGVAFVQRKEMV